MCQAVPMKIVHVENQMAIAELDGVRREANLRMLDEEVNVGDYVMINAGLAFRRLEEEEALETIALLRECLEQG